MVARRCTAFRQSDLQPSGTESVPSAREVDRRPPGTMDRVDHWDLSGRVVIVTGASSGIGAGTARLAHAAGAVPVLAAGRADRLEALTAELGGALAVPTDMRDRDAVRTLAETVVERHGRIDALVN